MRKSNTCMSHTGDYVSEYDSFDEAQDSAIYQNFFNRLSLEPYLCEKCGKYHLRPTTPYVQKLQYHCPCCNSDGQPKDAYPSQREAQKVVDHRRREGIYLHVYKCPYGNGFHLTHRRQRGR